MERRVLRIPVARAFVPLLEHHRYKGAWGGRGGAKSHFFAADVVDRAVDNPALRVVGIRETQKSLDHSVKQLIADKIRDFDVGYAFDIQDRIIKIRGKGDGHIIFQGMKQHTAESIKSLEGYDIAWTEEAHALSRNSLKMLRPTIRKPGSELWFSWNARRRTDPVDQLLRGPHPPRNSCVINVNWRDNPWFPEELNEDRLDDKIRDPDGYAHVWEGAYLEDHAYQLIASQWIYDAQERDFVDEGSRPKLRISVDVSDGGTDETVITARREYYSFDHYLRQESFRFPQSEAPILAAEAALAMYEQFDGDKHAGDDIIVDAMGVGAGTAGMVMRSETPCIAYAGGSQSDNPKKWRNRRVQSYMSLRNRFRDGKIVFDPDFVDDQRDWDQLVDQLCMVRREPAGDRVEDLETKEKLKEREGMSPDRADSMAMQYATQVPTLRAETESFVAWSQPSRTVDSGRMRY